MYVLYVCICGRACISFFICFVAIVGESIYRTTNTHTFLITTLFIVIALINQYKYMCLD